MSFCLGRLVPAIALAGATALGCRLPVAAAAAQDLSAEALIVSGRCSATIRRQLDEWDARLDAAFPEPVGPTGLRSVHAPTGAIGIWVRVAEEEPGGLLLERITSTRMERRRFTEACAATDSAVAIPRAAPDAFTDGELITRVARADRGVVLLWSPHMPLSVDQHAVLAEVARELGMVVIAVLDPSADPGYAARVAGERRLPPDATLPLGGVELAFRGMTTHTPSLQLFAGGRLIGPVLYGYRSATALRAAIEQTLAGR
jgi:hypothetical protein